MGALRVVASLMLIASARRASETTPKALRKMTSCPACTAVLRSTQPVSPVILVDVQFATVALLVSTDHAERSLSTIRLPAWPEINATGGSPSPVPTRMFSGQAGNLI